MADLKGRKTRDWKVMLGRSLKNGVWKICKGVVTHVIIANISWNMAKVWTVMFPDATLSRGLSMDGVMRSRVAKLAFPITPGPKSGANARLNPMRDHRTVTTPILPKDIIMV